MTTIRDEEVLSVLRAMECEGDLAILTGGQLDRKLYEKINKVLVALGGKWNKKRGGHVFAGDAAAILKSSMRDGEYHDTKKETAFFETPPDLADEVAGWAAIDPGTMVLEPSAGKGALVRAAEACGGHVSAVEINPEYCQDLHAAGASVAKICDFLQVWPTHDFDRVVMNPPFSIANKQTDVAHVMHALDFLKPGGVLVAIMSPSWTFRETKDNKAFRQLVDEYGEWHDIEAGAFKASGTNIKTVMVKLRKP